MSIKLQNQIQANEIRIQQLEATVKEQKQVLDALVSIVEKNAGTANEDRALVKLLMEQVHGKGLRVATGRQAPRKQAAKETV